MKQSVVTKGGFQEHLESRKPTIGKGFKLGDVFSLMSGNESAAIEILLY